MHIYIFKLCINTYIKQFSWQYFLANGNTLQHFSWSILPVHYSRSQNVLMRKTLYSPNPCWFSQSILHTIKLALGIFRCIFKSFSFQVLCGNKTKYEELRLLFDFFWHQSFQMIDSVFFSTQLEVYKKPRKTFAVEKHPVEWEEIPFTSENYLYSTAVKIIWVLHQFCSPD